MYRKNDEELRPWHPTDAIWTTGEQSKILPKMLCVGIGTYKTTEDGEIYLCVLIEPKRRIVYAYSLGVYRSPELVGKALKNLFFEKTFSLTLLSSRNAIYQKKLYGEILAQYPVEARMTTKGSRGGVIAVSSFYSRLMRRKGSEVFRNWQEAVDWLSRYIFYYNYEMNIKNRNTFTKDNG